MEFLLVLGIFGIAFILLSVGVIFSKKEMHAGTCGSNLIINGEKLSCGACPSKQAEICASGDKDGYATVAQLGNPSRKKTFNDRYFFQN